MVMGSEEENVMAGGITDGRTESHFDIITVFGLYP